jgi:hypothetical protein
MNMQTGINGVYNLFDKDGYHFCVFGGTKVLKCFDDNRPHADLRIIAAKMWSTNFHRLSPSWCHGSSVLG